MDLTTDILQIPVNKAKADKAKVEDAAGGYAGLGSMPRIQHERILPLVSNAVKFHAANRIIITRSALDPSQSHWSVGAGWRLGLGYLSPCQNGPCRAVHPLYEQSFHIDCRAVFLQSELVRFSGRGTRMAKCCSHESALSRPLAPICAHLRAVTPHELQSQGLLSSLHS